MEIRVTPEYLAWAVGYGVFIAFAAGSVVAPPDPFTQLFVVGGFLPVVVPVMYNVVARAHDRRERGESRRLTLFFVVVVLAGSVASKGVAAALGRSVATAAAAGAFLATFLALAWLFYWRDTPTAA
ncbi:hypothetical protein VB779_17695 [Haloarculaceae archaeon H-GB11]|nr:hypothetical protein [Haloarculaceae archaeon H-GB11]